jgi:hypothetical protein
MMCFSWFQRSFHKVTEMTSICTRSLRFKGNGLVIFR